MKKLHKATDVPTQLVAFQAGCPHATWAQLRAEGRSAYDQLCKTLETDQSGLCAYCELSATKDGNSLQVEHIVAKSFQEKNNVKRLLKITMFFQSIVSFLTI